ncbi:MAG: hypothetical protein CM15mP22_0450 [Gammaproteobacteria bacterium]|nr:MAG: hypothetical protein CM15mP22_0450 [Gammaproteobacteria bacterium]
MQRHMLNLIQLIGRKDAENDFKNQFENNIETVLITPYRIEPTKVEGERCYKSRSVWSNKNKLLSNGSKENILDS